MVYIACEKDRERILDFLKFDPAMNLFAIGDIINFEIGGDNLKVFLDKEEDFNVVYTLYYKYLLISSKEDKNIDLEFIKELSENDLIINYSGNHELIKNLKLDGFNLQKTYLLSLMELEKDVNTSEVTRGSVDDIKDTLDSMSKVFDMRNTNIDAYYDEIKNKSKRIHFIKKDGIIVSGASTTAESKYSAMIVGVFTLEEYRNKGYASKVMISLCKELLNEGKLCCLFFENPIAGSMYYGLGFKDSGIYSNMRKNND